MQIGFVVRQIRTIGFRQPNRRVVMDRGGRNKVILLRIGIPAQCLSGIGIHCFACILFFTVFGVGLLVVVVLMVWITVVLTAAFITHLLLFRGIHPGANIMNGINISPHFVPRRDNAPQPKRTNNAMQKTLSALSQHQCGLFRAPLLLILPNLLMCLPSTDIG